MPLEIRDCLFGSWKDRQARSDHMGLSEEKKISGKCHGLVTSFVVVVVV